MPANEWVALHVRTGTELEVVRQIRKFPKIVTLFPMEQTIQRKGGRQRKVVKPLLPGYLLIKWQHDPMLYYRIRSIPGVIRFLGDWEPHVIPEEQLRIWIALAEHCETRKPAKAVKVHGLTRIIDGPLTGFSSRIKRMNKRTSRAQLDIQLFNEIHTVTVAVCMKPESGGG